MAAASSAPERKELTQAEKEVLSILVFKTMEGFDENLANDRITASRDTLQKGLEYLNAALSQIEDVPNLREPLLKAIRQEIHTNPQYKIFLDMAMRLRADVTIPPEDKISEGFFKGQKENLDKSSNLHAVIHELLTYKMIDAITKKRSAGKSPTGLFSASKDLKETKQKPELNGVQINLLEGFFENTFPDLKDANEAILDSLKRAITEEKLQEGDKEILEAVDMFYEINSIREVLFHPCPQNRRTGDQTAVDSKFLFSGQEAPEDGVLRGDVFYWAKGDFRTPGSEKGHERQGLLGLTARNDDTANPVTRRAVVDFIGELANKKIMAKKSELDAQKAISPGTLPPA